MHLLTASLLSSTLRVPCPTSNAGRRAGALSTKQHCALRPTRIAAVALAEPLADPTVEEYNKRMAEKMGWTSLDNPFEYRPERGR